MDSFAKRLAALPSAERLAVTAWLGLGCSWRDALRNSGNDPLDLRAPDREPTHSDDDEGRPGMKWQIPYDGRNWEFDDSRVTASEARAQKRITEGLRPTDADAARLALDPDAWTAALVIARRRAGLDDEEAQAVDGDLLELGSIFETTRLELEARRAAQSGSDTAAADSAA